MKSGCYTGLVGSGSGGAILAHGTCQRRVVVQTSLKHSGAVGKLRQLLEVAYAQPVAWHHAPAVGGVASGKNAQQCGLAGAVASHDSGLVAFVDAESHVAEEQAVAETLRKVFDL